MSEKMTYWTKRVISRRVALRTAAVAGTGVAALSLVGCGGGSSSSGGTSSPTASNANENGPKSAVNQPAQDSTKGKAGGKLVIQGAGYPASFVMAKASDQTIAQFASFCYSGLLDLKSGKPGIDGTDPSPEPDLAQALPEQPDELTYVFKLMPAKFQNGRPVTSQDVKYSLERYATDPGYGARTGWVWLDRVDTPDPQTAVVKAKFPFADALPSLIAKQDAFIMAKEWEEGPEAATKFMGSGPYLFVDTTAPVVAHYKRNPDYFRKPYPYFDEVELLGNSDYATKVAQLSAKQAQMSYWYGEDDRVKIRQARPDLVELRYGAPPHGVFMRCDVAPYNDKRVRQALSMAINRQTLIDGTTRGYGVIDQVLSSASKFWGFRKPSELGAAFKYWSYDPQAAKQLLSAAGVSAPFETQMSHWDATPIGQTFVDTATLVQTSWRQAGVANSKDITTTLPQGSTTYMVGNFDGTYLATGGLITVPAFGLSLKSIFSAPPTPPTQNTEHITDPVLADLVDKQLRQLKLEDRKATLRQVEDVLAEEQYRIPLISYYYNWYLDPSLKNAQTPIFSTNGGLGYTKWWWSA